MVTTVETIEETTISLMLRKANSEDFKKTEFKLTGDGLSQLVAPKIGQPYWLKSIGTHKFDNRNYQISEDTDWEEFKKYLRLEMVYVPASDIN